MKKYEFYSIIFISPDSAATYLVNPLTAGASSARDRFFEIGNRSIGAPLL